MRRLTRAAVVAGPSVSMLSVIGPVEAHTTGIHDNCTDFNKRFPHGVGTRKVTDKMSGTPVTGSKRTNRTYWRASNQNEDLDRDNYGIACEKA